VILLLDVRYPTLRVRRQLKNIQPPAWSLRPKICRFIARTYRELSCYYLITKEKSL
jgi:hypothetical protein